MSTKGNKAKASKDPTPKRAPSAGRLPARSPIDDGMRSQMFNLSPALSQRRRSNSPLLPGLADPPPKKRKVKVSFDNTSASAADKSSSAEDIPISASAADKSSSDVEGTPTPPLGIRLSEAIDQRLLQLGSSKIPEKEHSVSEGDKGPGYESGSTPLAAANSSRASLLGPWGDREDEEETKSSEPPKIEREDSLFPALHAEDSLSNNQTGLVPVSERHKFKKPSSSPTMKTWLV
jgi:hypothetical protein